MNARNILFIHQAFPGQFGSLAASLANEGHRVFALSMGNETVPGVSLVRYKPQRDQKNAKEMPALQQEIDVKLIRGESAYDTMKAMKRQGYNPDVVYAHPGWGDAMFVKEVWPEARLVVYAEWYYNLQGQEVNFDPGMPALSEEKELRLKVKNLPFLQGLSDADAAVTPTKWQKSRFPKWAQDKIEVIHDGLNLQELYNVKPRSLGLSGGGLKLTKGMPIVTFAARYLEPVRGFHYFMRALPMILQANPNAHVIVMGRDAGMNSTGYGDATPEGTSWRQKLKDELGDRVDWSRVHFLGNLDRKLYLAMLKLSACHVHLTTPFVLSWSFLEAAAMGLPIVASDTAPIREMDYLDGLKFVNFDDPEGIARAVTQTLAAGPQDYMESNIEKLKPLDHRAVLPRIREVLLKNSPASDVGGPVESLILLDEE